VKQRTKSGLAFEFVATNGNEFSIVDRLLGKL
jgi:hypothetical protein